MKLLDHTFGFTGGVASALFINSLIDTHLSPSREQNSKDVLPFPKNMLQVWFSWPQG